MTGIALQSAFNRPESVSKPCVSWRSVSLSRGSTRQRMLPSFQPPLTIFAAIGSVMTCATPSTLRMSQAKRSSVSMTG